MPRRKTWRVPQDLDFYGDDELYVRDETIAERDRTDSARAAHRIQSPSVGSEFFNLNDGEEVE